MCPPAPQTPILPRQPSVFTTQLCFPCCFLSFSNPGEQIPWWSLPPCTVVKGVLLDPGVLCKVPIKVLWAPFPVYMVGTYKHLLLNAVQLLCFVGFPFGVLGLSFQFLKSTLFTVALSLTLLVLSAWCFWSLAHSCSWVSNKWPFK